MSLTAAAKISATYILAVVLYASGSTLWDATQPHPPGMMSGVLLAGQ